MATAIWTATCNDQCQFGLQTLHRRGRPGEGNGDHSLGPFRYFDAHELYRID
jgi:hypothetical protein